MNKLKSIILVSLTLLFSCQTYTGTNLQENTQTQILSEDINTQGSSGFTVVKTLDNPKFWNKIELIRATNESIDPELMLQRGRHRDQDIINTFGTDLPPATDFCLHDMGEPKELKNKTPILLIHGANTTATRSWADPEGDGKKQGLAQYLKSKGFRVFAITFSNKHGDSFVWSSHVGRAIERIKQITKAEKVDALGHSKGGFTLRLHTSNVFDKINPFKKNIRKAMFIGAPHRGIDFSFRHPVINWGLIEDDGNAVKYAPLSWKKMLWKGQWIETKEMYIDSGYFKGQLQMLARLDKVYPLPMVEQDWYTSYNGGQGFTSYTDGIDVLIKKGGNIVDKLMKSPVDPSVKVYNLAGDKNNVPGILNEYTGKSDGVLFTYSASATKDLTGNGAVLADSKVMNLNHLDLVSAPEAMDWISKSFAD
ncbi:MAG: acetyltransferase [Candidatus Sericytochromatia bacterium]